MNVSHLAPNFADGIRATKVPNESSNAIAADRRQLSPFAGYVRAAVYRVHPELPQIEETPSPIAQMAATGAPGTLV